ncbi:unnamed protein product, partial [Adineta steineri]
LPKIFHVNWFRLDENKKFLWPGFGDNIRVLDWIVRRTNGEDIADISSVGLIVDWDKLMSVPKDYWKEDIEETLSWLDGQLGEDLPHDIRIQIEQQKQRISQIN